MTEEPTHAEYLLVRKTAEEYRRQGYAVALESQLDFFPGFRADLVVRKNGEKKVIEVKSRSSVAANPKIGELARIIDSKPGWSFEWLLVAEPEKLESHDDARAFDRDSILRRIEEAKKALASGLPEAAFILAWSACEAVVRALIAAEGIEEPGITVARHVLGQAVSLGAIDRDEYRNLIQLQKYRNAIVHGFSHEDFDMELVSDLIETARRMMLMDQG